ncbi:FAD:protein FMN transferase [soil metagenome]
MRESRLIMGMPVHLEIVDADVPAEAFEEVFEYFKSVDERFSTYKHDSEISRINRGEIATETYSPEMKEVFQLASKTTQETNGYFSIRTPEGSIDPSGIVKGWAIQKAAELLQARGYQNFYLEIGGDIQTRGQDPDGAEWSIGIRHPFTEGEIVKVVFPKGKGIATSGTYIRGNHIYNPHAKDEPVAFVSLTVIGPTVYEADRFATAAFAMGEVGMTFLEQLPGFEAYAIDGSGIATMTSGFEIYTTP